MELVPDNLGWRFGFYEETMRNWRNKIERTQKFQLKAIKKQEDKIMKLQMKCKKMRNKSKEQDLRITELENRLSGAENKVASIFHVGSGKVLGLGAAELSVVHTPGSNADDRNHLAFPIANRTVTSSSNRLFAESTNHLFKDSRQGLNSYLHSEDAELRNTSSSDSVNLENILSPSCNDMEMRRHINLNSSKRMRSSALLTPPKTVSSDSEPREGFADVVARRKKKRTSSLIIEDVTARDESCETMSRSSDQTTKGTVPVDANHDNGLYSCGSCNLDLCSQELLGKHNETVHGHHECPFCVKQLTSVGALEKHIRKVHENNNSSEQKCVEVEHEDVVAAVSEKPVNVVEDETQPIEVQHVCEICGEIFLKRKALKRHKRSEHIEEDVSRIELSDFKDPTDAEKQTIDSSAGHVPFESSKGGDGVKPVYRKCFVCNKRLALPLFVSHLQQEHPETVFSSCSICPNAYKNVMMLNTHLKHTHQQVVPETPKSVKKPVSQLLRLSKPKKLIVNYSRDKIRQAIKTIHSQTSADRKGGSDKGDNNDAGSSNGVGDSPVEDPVSERYDCLYCHKQYQKKSAYDKHMEMHAHRINAGFYECAFCKLGFNFWSEFEAHVIATHREIDGVERRLPPASRGMTPTKKYRCSLCDKEFIDKEAMRQHVVNVHAWKRAYLCTECDKSFCTQDLLRRHTKKHHLQQKK